MSARTLAEAFIDLLYFNKNINHIKISMKRLGDVPENVSITCSGRGSLKGNVIDGKFHGIIRGTPRQVKAWQRFFNKFISVPAFSLTMYINWVKSNNDNNNSTKRLSP